MFLTPSSFVDWPCTLPRTRNCIRDAIEVPDYRRVEHLYANVSSVRHHPHVGAYQEDRGRRAVLIRVPLQRYCAYLDASCSQRACSRQTLEITFAGRRLWVPFGLRPCWIL